LGTHLEGGARAEEKSAQPGEKHMASNVFAGKWKQIRGDIKKRWGKLTDDDLDQAEGNWDKFVGKLQERYGKSRDDADKEAKKFFDNLA
jgi:uncharacterized protein YjbJ (UPF0337 family)